MDEALRLERSGKIDEAAAAYEAVLRASGGHADALLNLSAILLAKQRPEEAIRCARKALNQNPRLAGAHINIGNALQQLRRHGEAIERYRRALELEPGRAEAHSNLGFALAALDRPEEAIAHYRQALGIAPRYATALVNLGQALEALNRHEEAIGCYREAQAVAGHLPLAAWNEALASLAVGDFERGWPLYETRWTAHPAELAARRIAAPRWDGEDLDGKTILVHAEQGLGDTLQFVRYVPLLAQRNARVWLEVQQPLVTLLAQTPGVAQIGVPGEGAPPCDFHCPLPSLPLAFRTRIETIPAEMPYCHPPAERTAHWDAEFAQVGRPRLGFVAAGNRANWRGRRRNLPLAALLPLLERARCHCFCLEKDIAPADAALLGGRSNVTLLGSRLGDFAETAAVIAALDLVISVDTAVAHLAGAMGKPVWILLPFAAEWRWLRAREDSPWYPSARLFRQTAIGDWQSVIARVAAALDEWSARLPAA